MPQIELETTRFSISTIGFEYNNSTAGSNPVSNARYSAYHVENISGLNYAFPSLHMVGINNSTKLADFLSNRLGLNGPPTPIWNVPKNVTDSTVHRSHESYIMGRDSETWPVRQVSYNLTDGIVFLNYDDQGSDSNNTFLSFRIVLIDSGLKGNSLSEMRSVAWSIVDSLGIPRTNLSEVSEPVIMENVSAIPLPDGDYQTYESFFPASLRDGRCTRADITLSSSTMGTNISGANIITFTFNNDTGQLIRVEGSVFVEVPATLLMTFERAMEIGKNETPKSYSFTKSDPSAKVHVEEESIESLRLFTIIDSGDGLRKDILSIEYVSIISIEGSNSRWMVIVLIEPTSGGILSSWVTWMDSYLPPGFLGGEWPIAGALLAISILVIGILVGPPEFGFAILGMFLVPLYLRIKDGKALENFNRGRIFQYISANPGCSFTELKRELSILNGGLAYHLYVLEKLAIIKSFKDNKNRRFFTIDAKPSVTINQKLNRVMNKIMPIVTQGDPSTTSQIADKLGISRQRAHYNLIRLERLGLVIHSTNGWHSETDMHDGNLTFMLDDDSKESPEMGINSDESVLDSDD